MRIGSLFRELFKIGAWGSVTGDETRRAVFVAKALNGLLNPD
jgi:hypothetical protein